MARDLEKKKAYQKDYYLRNREKAYKYKRDYYEKNREICLERVKEWVKNNPKGRKRNYLKATYNLSLEDYNLMFEKTRRVL